MHYSTKSYALQHNQGQSIILLYNVALTTLSLIHI